MLACSLFTPTTDFLETDSKRFGVLPHRQAVTCCSITPPPGSDETTRRAHLIDDHMVRAGHHQGRAGVRPCGRFPRDAHHITVSSSTAATLVKHRAFQHPPSLSAVNSRLPQGNRLTPAAPASITSTRTLADTSALSVCTGRHDTLSRELCLPCTSWNNAFC